jgi:hypothetical protein
VYALEWGPAAMGRGVGFWIWFWHGIGLVFMGMCVVKAGAASRKTELGGGCTGTSYPEVGGRCLSGGLPVLAGGGGPCVTSGDV